MSTSEPVVRPADDRVEFRCRYPENCNCCTPNKKTFDFVVTALRVVERRRDELKAENQRFRSALEAIRDGQDLLAHRYPQEYAARALEPRP